MRQPLKAQNGSTVVDVNLLSVPSACIDDNGKLDLTPLLAVSYSEVTGTSQSAAVNHGYITNNASLVTVTLPSTAAVGDIVKIVGSGAGGWKLAQNASQEVKWTAGGVDGTNETTAGTGGSLASTDRYDSVTVQCVATNNTWVATDVKGILQIT